MVITVFPLLIIPIISSLISETNRRDLTQYFTLASFLLSLTVLYTQKGGPNSQNAFKTKSGRGI